MNYTLTGLVRHEEDIKRSRFLAIAAPCTNEAEVEAFLTTHSVPDATHNCYAWRIGHIYRFNDDGEPAGTAGRPILQALDGQNLDQVAVLVVRWFGGIKLGAGGLIRAYGGSAARCLQAGTTRELIQYVQAQLHIPFEQLGTLHQRLEPHHARIIDEQYRAQGLYAVVELPQEQRNDFLTALRDASGGTIVVVESNGG